VDEILRVAVCRRRLPDSPYLGDMVFRPAASETPCRCLSRIIARLSEMTFKTLCCRKQSLDKNV
jgi:hypothetical protein